MKMQLLHLAALACLSFSWSGLASPSDRPYGTFRHPAARVRPKFRYWLPDAGVSKAVVQKDIANAADIGIGGVEFLPFFNYGGGVPSSDWSIFGFGTPAFQDMFKAALEAHRDNGLIMDFSMGPNQGQGVPAHANNTGLQWDLVTSAARVSPDGRFDQTLPGWGSGELVAAVSALVLSETPAQLPPRAGVGLPYNYTKLLLKSGSLSEITHKVSVSGSLSTEFPSTQDPSHYYQVFAFYQRLTHVKNLDPRKNSTETIFDEGCYIVDHFDPKGARVVTDFWEKYMLTNGTRELLSQVGNSGWEDSMELRSNVSWSPSLPARFEKRWGYSLKKILPLVVWGNNNVNIQSAAPGLIQSQLDEEDHGSGYNNDFRVVLAEAYQDYLKVITQWTKSYLDLQHSSQVSYNLPMDMEASIPFEDVPECESFQFRDNVDGYRQFSGAAYLSDRNVVSVELGAIFGHAFTFTVPQLLYGMNRAASGGVNQYVIHGQQFSGEYPATTWPGYVSFGYRVSDQYSEKRPDWHHGLEQGLRYMGRVTYTQQQGIPRIDVAFYNRQTATDPTTHTLYQQTDLQREGWSYVYLSPDNFKLPQAKVAHGVLAPGGPSFRAIIIESTQNMTLDAIKRLSHYAASGLPIILSGGPPGYYPSGDSSGKDAVEDVIGNFVRARNVHTVKPGEAASKLNALGLSPRIKVQTKGTWFTTWREDGKAGIDYAYIFASGNDSSGSATLSSTKKPFWMNAWTREISPVLIYQKDKRTTTIPLSLSGNETATIAFSDRDLSGNGGVPKTHITDVTVDVLGYKYSHDAGICLHVPFSRSARLAQLSLGKRVRVDASDVPAATPLTSWTLTAEHWEAPKDLNDSSIIADKRNTTHELSSLISWLDLPQLANVSGLGYYSSNFTWATHRSSKRLGAYISFSKILDAVTIYINGRNVGPVDYNHADVDISAYLRPGINEVHAVVPTTMWNYLQTITANISNAGAKVTFSGGAFGSSSVPQDNGLVGTVRVIPYKTVNI